MAKKDRVVLVTPRGRAIYPHLTTPDTKFKAEGQYHVRLAIPTALAEKLIEQIDAAYEKAQVSALEEVREKNPKTKSVKAADLPYKQSDEDESETLFNFK